MDPENPQADPGLTGCQLQQKEVRLPADVSDPEAEDACRRQPKCCGRPGAPGRQLFISEPTAEPASRPDCYILGKKGYGRPFQHPLYRTTSANYGRYEPPPALNSKRFPRSTSFTTHLGKCGMYQDLHLTTELEADNHCL